MPIFRALLSALPFAALLAAGNLCAQSTTIQFPRSGLPATGNFTTPPATVVPSTSTPITPLPGNSLSPYGRAVPAYGSGATVPGGSAIAPGTTTYVPPSTFDPYSTAPNVPNPWYAAPAPSGGIGTSPFGSAPVTGGGFSPPASPFANPSPGTYSPPLSGSPYITPGTYPNQAPSALFPDGLWGSNPAAQPYDYNQTLRLVQSLSLTHTYVGGGSDPTDVNINDTVAAVTFAFPNFLFTNQPIFITPTFGLHLWDGPHSIPADLPPNAYSAFLDAQYITDPNLQVGAELGFRIGVYTDFDTFNTHSLRIQGVGLGTVRLTPTTTLKLGVMYLDRNRIKVLPAGGILWQPSPQVRFDIYFPQPKLASYLATINNQELWWYVAGEYGGGAWTIERADATSDRIDINDIRVSIGLETMGQGRLSGFAEVGYVFHRQVVYVVDPSDTFEPGNTFMVRLGIAF